jgi:Tfp pilus assembly protein PilF
MACSQAPQTLEELTEAGQMAVASGDYRQARTYLSQALLESPSNRDLLYLMGACYLREYMYDSAHLYLRRADLLHPNDHEVNLALADASKGAGQWLDARHALEVIIKKGDANNEYLEDLLNVSLQGGEHTFAYYYARQILPHDADNADRYLLVASLAAQLDSPEVAINVMDSALERFGSREEFLNNKATFLIAAQDYPSAERIFRNLTKQDSSSIEYRLNLVSCLMSQDTRAKSQEAYDMMLAINSLLPNTPTFDSVLAQLRLDLNIESE